MIETKLKPLVPDQIGFPTPTEAKRKLIETLRALRVYSQHGPSEPYIETTKTAISDLFFRQVTGPSDICVDNSIDLLNLSTLLSCFNLNAAELFDAWDKSHSDLIIESQKDLEAKNALVSLYRDNFIAMYMLEAKREGITQVLHDQFGIKVFGRYPAEILINQYDQRDNAEQPYGLVVTPRHDYSGAFYDLKETLRTLNSRLEGNHLLRVVEATGPADLIKKLANLHRRYWLKPGTSRHKISFGLLGGHGSPVRIVLGDYNENGVLSLFNLKSYIQGINRLHPLIFFEKGATVILNSCSTGVEGGMAQHLANTTGLIFIGPNTDGAIWSIGLQEKSHTLIFNVEYYDPEGENKVETKAYRPANADLLVVSPKN